MIIERLARAGLRSAARRWPPGMAEEWTAELVSLRGHPWRMLTFAGSLLISPAVDEPSWGERATGAATAAGVTLLAAALFNGVHVTGHPILLLAAAAVMAVAGARVRHPHPALIGLALFAFLMAGNEVAVMPFMGVLDITPAVGTWTLGTAIALRFKRPIALPGALVTLLLATIAGSWHGATVLGSATGGLLLANATAMAGPMLLCTVFLLTRPSPRAPRARLTAGIAAALGSLAFCEWMSRSTPAPHHLLDNTFTFGFGFATHPIGSAAVALLIALLVVRDDRVADPM